MSINMRMLRFEEIGPGELDILKRGTDKSGHNPLEFRDALMDGTGVMWRVTGPETDGLVITQENEYNGRPALFILYLCGTGAHACMKHVQDTLIEFAKLRGRELLWARVGIKPHEHISKPLGWDVREYVMVKEI